MAQESREKKKVESKPDEKPLLSWSTPDAMVSRRDSRFYLVVLGAGIVLAGILAWQTIWTGVALVALVVIILLTIAQSKPKNIESAIFNQGIVVDQRAYDFSDLKSFWIVTSDVIKVKFRQNGRFFAGELSMPVSGDEVDSIREILLAHLPEEEGKGEDIVDTINRFIRL